MVASELTRRQRGEITAGKQADPFIFSPELVVELKLMEFVHETLRLAEQLRPSLPAGAGDRARAVM